MIQTWFDPEEVHLFFKNAQLFPIFINISNVQTKKDFFLFFKYHKIVFTWLWRGCNHRWKIRCRWSHLSIILRIIWSENVWLLWHHGIRTWDHRGWLHIRSWRLIGCWNLIWNMSSIAEINKRNEIAWIQGHYLVNTKVIILLPKNLVLSSMCKD